VRLISTAKSTQFKGFLLQAHNADEEAIGYFEIPEGSPSKTLNCPNNRTMVLPQISNIDRLLHNIAPFYFFLSQASVTHVDSDAKTSVDFLWSPPLDFEGKLFFT